MIFRYIIIPDNIYIYIHVHIVSSLCFDSPKISSDQDSSHFHPVEPLEKFQPSAFLLVGKMTWGSFLDSRIVFKVYGIKAKLAWWNDPWWVRISLSNAGAVKAWVGARCKARWYLTLKKRQLDIGQISSLWWNQRRKNSSFSLNAQKSSSISHFEHRKHQQWTRPSSSKPVFKRRKTPTTGVPAIPFSPGGMGLTPSKFNCQRRSRPEVTLNPFSLNHLGLGAQW